MNLDKRYTKTMKAKEFLDSTEGQRLYSELQKMIASDEYNTDATFSPSAKDGELLFIDKHMNYVCAHLNINTEHYLSNLRLITKRNRS